MQYQSALTQAKFLARKREKDMFVVLGKLPGEFETADDYDLDTFIPGENVIASVDEGGNVYAS